MEDSLGSSDSEKELKHELVDAGIKLLPPPSSTDELLMLLDKIENILSQVGQDPSRSMRDALVPSMKALVSDELLRHPLMDVKVSVVSCIHEIVRITAPCQPYDDEKMKEIFELTVIALGMLSHLSGHCYSKALQILETVAKVRSCVILLDLGCDALIVEIFQLFFDTIMSNHPHSVISNMEEIMTRLIDESDDISLELLKPLLASVKKENQTISPHSWKLGAEVLKCGSAKVKPYLTKAVKLMKLDFDDYSEVVTFLCQDEVSEDVKPDAHLKEIGPPAAELFKALQDDLTMQKRIENKVILENQNSSKKLESLGQIEQLKSIEGTSSLEPEALANGRVVEAKANEGAIPRRRGRKPNSLMKPEEGYRHPWTGEGKNALETPHTKKNNQNVVNSTKISSPKESPRTLHVAFVHSPNTQGHSGSETNRRRRGRPKKESTTKDHLTPGQVKENGEQNIELALTMGSCNTEDAKEKSGRGPRRKKCSSMSDREVNPPLSMVVPKEEHDVLSDSEVKPYLLLNHMDGTRAMEEKANLEEQSTKEFNEKIMLSPVAKVVVRDHNLSDNTMKSKCRRKRASQGEEGFKRPTLVKDYGEELVGSRIKVWWPLDQMFYEGVINSFYPSTKKHEVLYIDGDQEILNLNKERWMLLGDVPINQDEEADLPTTAVMSAKSERTKAKRMAKFKIKQDNPVSSAKRSKSAPRKCGSKSAESSTIDTLCMKELDNAKINIDNAEKDHDETQK